MTARLDGIRMTASQAGATPPEIGPVTLQEERLAADVRRFMLVAFIAALLFFPQVIAHFFVAITVLPTFEKMFADMGGQMPALTQAIVSLGPLLGVLLVAIDLLIFWACYRLARAHWIGLLFVPLFAGGAVSGLLVQALYLPLESIVTYVQ